MENIYIILNEDGTLDTVNSNTEIEVKVLRKGQDDKKIDEVESLYETVEFS